ncbi:Kinesin light chain [Seminavis robusta]|uniref:Kinesin light chain n=1 Tax=Seminavis robusta TaxID=568900 RepID=A0A9N8HJP7_9STRA|nr:Kinesin light chain [Seminavis robusta]|eukprot:Sro676_g185740.1 Kinesin light chain (548) ;mRNA; f:47031-48757
MSVSIHQTLTVDRAFIEWGDEEASEGTGNESQSTKPYHKFPIDRMWPTLFPYHEPTGFSVCAASKTVGSASSSTTDGNGTASAETTSSATATSMMDGSFQDDSRAHTNLPELLKDLHTRQLLDELQIQELHKDRDQIDGTVEYNQRMDRLVAKLQRQLKAMEQLADDIPPDCEEMAVQVETIAQLARSIGQSVTVKEFLAKALEIRQAIHGPKHPAIARILEEQGDLFNEEGCHKEAKDCCFEALAQYQSLMGPTHAVVGSIYFKMASAISNQGLHCQAFDFFNEALKIKKLHSRSNDAEVADVLETIGSVQIKMGDLDDALCNLQKARRIRRYRQDRLKLATTLKHLFSLFLSKTNYAVAIGYYEEWLVVLGDQYSLMGQSDEAIKFYREALTVRVAVLEGYRGCNDPTSLQTAGIAFREGQTHTAQEMYKEILETGNTQARNTEEKETRFHALLMNCHCSYLQGNTEDARNSLYSAAEVERSDVQFSVETTMREVLFKLVREIKCTSRAARVLERVKWLAWGQGTGTGALRRHSSMFRRGNCEQK